jgi:Tol biopolymer transport system component
MSYRISFFKIIALSLITTTCFSQGLPIKPARTISFTTDEGSYMNVDVSPDGKTLVFDLLGDLYSLPATGGDATQLTRGLSLHLRPRWCPDGKKIAFISDSLGSSHLTIMDLLTKSISILGLQDEDWEIEGKDIQWTSDGNYLKCGNKLYCLAGGEIGIKAKKAIINELPGVSGGMKSANGKWWAYFVDTAGKRCLVVQEIATKAAKILIPSLIISDPRYSVRVSSPNYSFSPDSRNIYISYGGKIHKIDIQSGKDQIIAFKANVKSDLAAFNYNTYKLEYGHVDTRYIRNTNESPDGKRIVFSLFNRICWMDLPNGLTHLLYGQTDNRNQPVNQYQPVYSPDGKWIAFVSWSDTDGGQLWKAAIPDSHGSYEPIQVTKIAGQYQRPAWSPDGTKLAIIKGEPKLGDRDDPGIGELQLIDLAKNNEIKVIDDSLPLLNNVQFSMDGQRISYTPKRKYFDTNNQFTTHFDFNNRFTTQLLSKKINGEGEQVIAIGAQSTQYAQKAISPDEKYIVYSVDEDLYLVATPPLDGPVMLSGYGDKQLPVVRFADGVDPFWQQGGKVLAWTYGNHFYKIDPEEIIRAAELKMEKEKSGANPQKCFVDAAVEPKATIPITAYLSAKYGNGILAPMYFPSNPGYSSPIWHTA